VRRGRLLLLLALVLIVAAFYAPALLRAAYLLVALGGRADHPLRIVAREVSTARWTVAAPRGPLPARLYLPRGGGRPGIAVLLHGVVPDGMDDARLVDFARALAACGVAVMTPDLPDIRAYLLTEATIDDIAAALQSAVQARDPRFDGRRAGLVGISYSATLGLIAASRPELRGRLRYAVAFGGYYDFLDAVHYSLTGKYDKGGVRLDLAPHPYARVVFYYNALDDMPAVPEPRRVRRILRLRLEDRVAEADRERAMLSPAARALVDDMLGISSAGLLGQAEAAFARHPEVDRTFSLAPHLRALEIPELVLVHSANDDIIPYGETLRLCRALQDRDDVEVECVVTRLFTHVDLSGSERRSFWGFTVPEHYRLLSAVYRVLRLAG
jgi:dienelactone hydrolase